MWSNEGMVPDRCQAIQVQERTAAAVWLMSSCIFKRGMGPSETMELVSATVDNQVQAHRRDFDGRDSAQGVHSIP
jgi:hypothetical protein